MTPTSIEQAQELLRGAKGRVVFVGGGTELGPPPPHDHLMSTAALNRIVDYAPSDQVVTAEAGVTLAALQRALAKEGQRLALEAPLAERATLGGIVAANTFGPLRARYGSVRDLIIGISIIRADGVRAKGGGKVVKTVAGFDLPKLMCGSRGTLGLIATVTFRVHPLPEHAVTIGARGLPGAQVLELVRKVRMQQLEPAAMLATRAPAGWDVALRFEGFKAGVVQQRDKLRELSDAPESIWSEHLERRGPVRFGALPSLLPHLEAALGPRASWYPTLGLGFADRVDAKAVAAAGGWSSGDPLPAQALQRAIKERFDSGGRFPSLGGGA